MKIFIAQPIQPEGVEILKRVAEVRSNPEGRPLERKEFLGHIKDVEAVVLPWHTDVMDREAIQIASRLQVIGRHGVGRESDFVSVNCALTERTRGLLGAKQFALMKPTAVMVNTARGPIVDQKALVEALKSKRIAAAGLDVFIEEPIPPGDPLLSLDNVVLLPHIGSAALEMRRKMAVTVAEDVVRVLTGKQPTYLLNPRVREVRPLG